MSREYESGHRVLRERRYGDLLVRFQYVKPNAHLIGEEHEPALVICRPERSGVRSAWIIMMTAAHKYVDDGETGCHSEYMENATMKIATMLGLRTNKRTRFGIAEAILDSLPDLLHMPPWSRAQKVIGEVEANFGGTLIKSEILH